MNTKATTYCVSLVDAFRERQWLPIRRRIKFKLASLTSRPCIPKPHRPSLVFSFVTVLPVFLGHLSLLVSYKFLALIEYFRFRLFPHSCPNYLDIPPGLSPFIRHIQLFPAAR